MPEDKEKHIRRKHKRHQGKNKPMEPKDTQHQKHTVAEPKDKQKYEQHQQEEEEPRDNQEYTVTEPKQRRQGRKERVPQKFAIEINQWNERFEVLNTRKRLTHQKMHREGSSPSPIPRKRYYNN